MRISKLAKPELCAAKEESRYAITYPWLDTEAGYVVATNGRCMVRIPVTETSDDTTGPIPTKILKSARKDAPRTAPEMSVVLNGTAAAYGVSMPRGGDPETRFPDYAGVIPSDKRPNVRLGLSAKYLLDIAKAMGTDSVVLEISAEDPDETPIVVRPVGEGIGGNPVPGALGVLMPISLGS